MSGKPKTKKSGSFLKASPAVKPLLPILGVVPALFFIVLFALIPAIINFTISLTNYNGITEGVKFLWFQNYVECFTVMGKEIFTAFWTTIKYALITVLPLQVLSISAAILVNNKIKGRNLFRALFFLPNILGVVVVCFAWKLIFDTRWGPMIQFLKALGLSSSLLGGEQSALLCVSVITLWANFGFYMTVYLAGLQGIPSDYYEAAAIDGAGFWVRLFKITLPLLKGSMVVCLWLSISNALGLADVIMLTTGGQYGTKTIGFYIYDSVINGSAITSQGMTSAVILYNFIFVTAVMLTFNALFRRKEVEL